MTEDQGTDQSKRIGDYEVLGVLGAGGMGKVFKVRNVISDRVEAMKILLPDLEGRQELAERFLREIKLANVKESILSAPPRWTHPAPVAFRRSTQDRFQLS